MKKNRLSFQNRISILNLRAKTQTKVYSLQILGEKVSTLDCIVSFATAALTASPIPYVKPSLNDRGRIELKQCRHPCIEQMDGINYIPNDAFFSDDGPKFYVITGPNLGKDGERKPNWHNCPLNYKSVFA